MFGRSVRLFRVFGIDIKIDMTWALFALLIGWSLATGVFPEIHAGLPRLAYWWMALVGVIGLAASIILHELGHSLVAKALGLPLSSITLFFFGGVAEMEREAEDPNAELLIATSGPLVSLALAVCFVLASWTVAEERPLKDVLAYLAALNVLLAVFNLVPAFPMDGGRVLRALLWKSRGDYRSATRTATRGGLLFGALMMGLGVLLAASGNFLTGIWWVLIGMFIRGAAHGATQMEASAALFRGVPVRRYMTTNPVEVQPQLNLREFVDDYLYRFNHDFFPVVEAGNLLGEVTLRSLQKVPRENWSQVTLREVLTKVSAANSIGAEADVMDALTKMHKHGASRLLVVESGRLCGVLVLKDLMQAIAIRVALEDN